MTVFRAPVVTLDWQLTLGFDLDNDPTTGITEGIWSEHHGIGPDLEFDYFADNAGSSFDQGPLAVWTWPDEQTLQVVISDTLVTDDMSDFEVAGQAMHPDYHDAIPDDGPLAWP